MSKETTVTSGNNRWAPRHQRVGGWEGTVSWEKTNLELRPMSRTPTASEQCRGVQSLSRMAFAGDILVTRSWWRQKVKTVILPVF